MTRTGPAQRRIGLLLLIGLSVAAGCSSAPKATEVEVEVRRVAMDHASRSPVVLLEDKAHTVALPIWIGPAEAQSIAMQIEGIEPPRPLTHDLVKTVLDQVGIEFRRVLIHELREGTYYARIFLTSHGSDFEIDSRPSDAIALAVRFRKPIFVAVALLEPQRTINLAGIAASETATLGGVTVQVLSEELAEYFELPAGGGLLVSNVTSGAVSQLRRGDVILEIDGVPVRGLRDFTDKVSLLTRRARLSVRRGAETIRIAFEPPPR